MSIAPLGWDIPINPRRDVFSASFFYSGGSLIAAGGSANIGPSAGGTGEWLVGSKPLMSWVFCTPVDLTLEIDISFDGAGYRHWRYFLLHADPGAGTPVDNSMSCLFVPGWSCRLVLHNQALAGGPYTIEAVVKLQAVT